ncbi:permease-like cell division protein FtsX [Actinoplanes sp. NPDC026670]|jgi:cell division protein FtsX|uniref:permease-like cell division protein FtsX n=1 Tax=Actinoplanes sp. NPDC026670 TaxID=3154700 RepID=UPI0033E6B561
MNDPQPTDDPPGRRWLQLLAVIAATLVLGSIASTTAMLLAGWRYAPEREFTVSVVMQPDADTGQREAVQRRLSELPAVDGVRLQTREQAYEKLRQRVSGDPTQMEGIEVATMPESLHLTTVGRDFDCGPLPSVRKMAGVDRIRVVMRPEGSRPGAELGC